MRKYIIKIVLLFAPLLLIVFSVNYLKDPGQVFNDRSKKAAILVADGNNVQLISMPAYWGKFQEEFLTYSAEAKKTKASWALWGSSRASEVTPSMIGKKDLHNYILPGASILDYIGLFNLCEEKNYFPDTLIISIDPWINYARKLESIQNAVYYIPDVNAKVKSYSGLNKYINNNKRLFDFDPRFYEINEAEKGGDYEAIFSHMFSPSYFQSSLKVLTKADGVSTQYFYQKGAFVIRKDGGYSLMEWSPELAASAAEEAATYKKMCGDNFFCGSCLKKPHLKNLEALIQALQKRGVVVCLFISPVHPSVYPSSNKTHSSVLEEYLVKLSRDMGICLVGSYNPYRYPELVTYSYFLDPYHISSKGMEIVTKNFTAKP